VGEEKCSACGGTGEYDLPENHLVDISGCLGCGGTGKQKKYDKVTRMVSTPKDAALRDELDKCDAHGRIVIAASFRGSVDRIAKICKARGWAIVSKDGRGWRAFDAMGQKVELPEPTKQHPIPAMRFWEEQHGKVAFVGNPGSCRYGLTLVAARTLVFFDNSFSAVQRLQMEDRVHRLGMDLLAGCEIVDLIHLPVDQLVVDTLKSNKKLELLSLGVIAECLGLDEDFEPCEELLE
jgi:hypothetical protein